jgi:hypothetical protein
MAAISFPAATECCILMAFPILPVSEVLASVLGLSWAGSSVRLVGPFGESVGPADAGQDYKPRGRCVAKADEWLAELNPSEKQLEKTPEPPAPAGSTPLAKFDAATRQPAKAV